MRHGKWFGCKGCKKVEPPGGGRVDAEVVVYILGLDRGACDTGKIWLIL